MIRDEIKRLFSDSEIDSAYPIESVGEKYAAYVVRFYNSFGVAVLYSGDAIKEEFANAEIYNGVLTTDNEPHTCLFLTSISFFN